MRAPFRLVRAVPAERRNIPRRISTRRHAPLDRFGQVLRLRYRETGEIMKPKIVGNRGREVVVYFEGDQAPQPKHVCDAFFEGSILPLRFVTEEVEQDWDNGSVAKLVLLDDKRATDRRTTRRDRRD